MVLVRALLLSCILFAPAALAERLEVPLRVPMEFVQAALARSSQRRQARPASCGARASAASSASSRRRWMPRRPPAPGRRPARRARREILGKCARPRRTGTAPCTSSLAPHIDERRRVRVRIVDSSSRRARRARRRAVWELGKRQLHPRLERFSYDLGASRDALARPPARHRAAGAGRGDGGRACSQIQVLEPRVEKTHVVVPIALEIPDAWLAAAARPAPAAGAAAAPLTEAELEALEKALEPLDAFLVYVIRQIAADSDQTPRCASACSRCCSTAATSSARSCPVTRRSRSGDPVRTLFLETWSELRAHPRRRAARRHARSSLLRYALFIDAGDALARARARRAGPAGSRPTACASSRAACARTRAAIRWPTTGTIDPQLRRALQGRGAAAGSRPRSRGSWLDFFEFPRARRAAARPLGADAQGAPRVPGAHRRRC